MLSFEQKLQILESYPELQRKNISLGRVNFHYEASINDKKTLALHLHPNGNGFIYAGLLQGYDLDNKGYVNIREFTEDELKRIVEDSIRSLSSHEEETPSVEEHTKETVDVDMNGDVIAKSYFHDSEVWINDDGESLTLTRDEDLWYIYTGSNIEMVFGTPQEAKEYLEEEGFRRTRE
ncbi:hypothetical protein D3C76_1189320 [compost metagenome]